MTVQDAQAGLLPLPLGFVKAFLLRGVAKHVLVDSGMPGSTTKIVAQLERGGVNVPYITLPFFGPLAFPQAGPTLTVIGLVAMMNVVNFSDGVDGLAAGVCAIVAAAMYYILNWVF